MPTWSGQVLAFTDGSPASAIASSLSSYGGVDQLAGRRIAPRSAFDRLARVSALLERAYSRSLRASFAAGRLTLASSQALNLGNFPSSANLLNHIE